LDRLRTRCEQELEERRLRTRKAEAEPVWLQNHRFVEADLLQTCRKSCSEARKQAGEIARDAFDYCLTKEMLDERVVRFKRTAAALAKGRGALGGAGGNGAGAWPNVFQGVDESETRRFAETGSALERDLDDMRRLQQQEVHAGSAAHDAGGGLGGHDLEDEDEEEEEGQQAEDGGRSPSNPFASSPPSFGAAGNPFAPEDENPFA
jgi:hypothetical protein